MLNGAFWPEMKNPSIALGMLQEDHAFCRPIIARLVGAPPNGRWTVDEVRTAAVDFWKDRKTLEADLDFKIWVTQTLHRVHLGLELSQAEAKQFCVFQRQVLLTIAVPKDALDVVRDVLKLDATLEDKERWLKMYRPALKKSLA